MIVKIDKTFEKDIDKIKDKILLLKIADCIEEIDKADNILSIRNLKKLKGTDKFYRVKLGEYRLGIQIISDTVEFIRCLHRKDIYKYFPK